MGCRYSAVHRNWIRNKDLWTSHVLYRSYYFDNNQKLVAHTAVQEAGERERRDESMIYTESINKHSLIANDMLCDWSRSELRLCSSPILLVVTRRPKGYYYVNEKATREGILSLDIVYTILKMPPILSQCIPYVIPPYIANFRLRYCLELFNHTCTLNP